MVSPNPARAFFETDTYCVRNPVLPVRARLVSDLLGRTQDASILDLGCGDGSISERFARSNKLTLVDFSPTMLARARPLFPDAELVQADVMEWRPDRAYDVVLAIGLLAHVSAPERLVEAVADAIRAGGRCILQITDTAHPLGWALARYGRVRQPHKYRLNELSLRDLIAMAGRHGLVPAATRRYGLLLPGTGWLPYSSRLWLERRFSSGPLARAGAEVLVLFEKRG